MASPYRERVLVLGASGLLGHHVSPCLISAGHSVVAHGHSRGADVNVDLTETLQTHSLLDSVEPTVIVNLAGLTDVDQCETAPTLAYRVNTLTTENIASWVSLQPACHMIHISTDHLYTGSGPHDETRVDLLNYYAFSKYCAEKAAQNARATILRTNFIGLSHCSNRSTFTDWLYRSLCNGDAIQVFDDVKFSPLSLRTLSLMIEKAVTEKRPGLFNLGSSEGFSKARFAELFAEECSLPTTKMTAASSDNLISLRARRPKDMRMNSSRFENTFMVQLPTLTAELTAAAREYHAIS